ncbi:MAG: hypothetical protein EVB05_09605 [Candidatus Thioglobus sp.]|nr:MAG: hypothetical protein EVB05_09605 [Candidatus Thioglobus sp.]
MNETADKWHRCQIDRTLLKALLKRTNWHGLVYLFYFIALLLTTGTLAFLSISTLWSIPAFLLFGGIWVFATSVAHETAHGTPFKNHALNESVLFVSGLMVQQTPCLLRYVHSHHHSHTAVVGDDPEIILTNPMRLKDFILKALIDIGSIWYFIKATVLLALHRPDQDAVRCIPVKKMHRAVIEAQTFLVIYIGIIVWSLIAQSWVPIVMFILPRAFGAPTHGVILATQHLGMAQNIKDHRHTTRTMIVNPILRVLYWNMNFHIEHHMFPQVPFHALPRLHHAIKDQCPTPTNGVSGALREIISMVRHQRTDAEFTTPRGLTID